MRPLARRVAAATLLALPSLGAQQAAPDSLRLSAMHAAAFETDPRQRQLALQATQTQLRLRNIDAERFPTLTVEGLFQYQSDVISLPSSPGAGGRPLSPPKETIDSRLVVRETFFDPTLLPRRAVEQATLNESQAQVRTTLFTLRQEVDDAFFTAAVFDARAGELRAAIVDLEGRRRDAVVRVREGVSLPSDTSSLDATILQRGEDELELRANRAAALARLARLTGRRVDESAVPALPDLAPAVTTARASLDGVRARPEYTQFAASRQRIASQSSVLASRVKPNISTFARLGYGKPGLNPLNNAFDSYWIGGIQLQWTPITWGALDRERQALTLQQEIVSANEAAFASGIRRAVEVDLQQMDRLVATLATDDRIIALREQVERETRTRLQEGVVTAAEYVTRNSELLQARLARATHRVALVQARAHFLATLGLEIR